jgi:hypothetical protein
MADSQDDGAEGRQAQANRRILCGVRRRYYIICFFGIRYSGKHDPYHYGGHYGCRVASAIKCRSMGNRRPDNLGVDTNDSLLGSNVRTGLPHSSLTFAKENPK